jgi:hypothetical protein
MKAKDRAELTKWLDVRYPPEATPLSKSSEYELNRSLEMGCVDARDELRRRLDYEMTRDMLLDVLEEWCDHVEQLKNPQQTEEDDGVPSAEWECGIGGGGDPGEHD